MLRPWHRADIFAALAEHHWSAPVRVEADSYEVGEAYVLHRGEESLMLRFVADLGTGFTGARSIEQVVGTYHSSGLECNLWLHRRSAGKWKRELSDWANTLSAGA